MTKKNKKIILITSMITILPILAGLILWNKLPEQVATHFDANGIPNGYSSRAFAVFGPYLICLFAHLFCAFGTLADPKKQAIGQKMYALILWICPAVSLFCAAAMERYFFYRKYHLCTSDHAATAGRKCSKTTYKINAHNTQKPLFHSSNSDSRRYC